MMLLPFSNMARENTDTKPQYFMCSNFRSLEAKKIVADIWQKEGINLSVTKDSMV